MLDEYDIVRGRPPRENAMIFLIEYNRREGRIVTYREFDESDSEKAANLRLEIELTLHREGKDHEVVLLEAVDEEALRRTHRRYFEDVRDIARSVPSAET